jgi:DNA (cytosine-5)-methyltransferase 1
METPVMALQKLRVSYKHMFSCDIDKNVKRQLLHNFPAQKWFDDLMTRDNRVASTPAVDIYIAGFPCQSFSQAGLQKGFKDKRGMVFYGCADYIDSKRPRAFILENVKQLINHERGNTFKRVMQSLESIGNGAYNLHWKLLNTLEHGVPQSRPRVYIIGIRKDCQRSEFAFPAPLPAVSIDNFLDPVGRTPTMQDIPVKSSRTAYTNVTRILKLLHEIGAQPLKKTFVLDCDASPEFCGVMRDRVMCMTKSRSNGHWLTSRARRMNLEEMLRCQGMERCFDQVVSDRALGAQIGNAMSQNVIERLLIKLLPAAGLVPESRRLVDRWAINVKKMKKAATDFLCMKEIRSSRARGLPAKRARCIRSSQEARPPAKRARTA